MNKQDYLAQKRFNAQKTIPVQKYEKRVNETNKELFKRNDKGNIFKRIYAYAIRRIYGIKSSIRKVFTSSSDKPPHILLNKRALPKQAIQSKRDHGHLWNGNSN